MGQSAKGHDWVWYGRFQIMCCACCGVPQDEDDTGRCDGEPMFCTGEPLMPEPRHTATIYAFAPRAGARTGR